ncbi:MAG TPA: DUF1361 domain-containing protein [Candidatus Saccharimonadales bacterium]|nr:DUF1361 domain-containing protein [Candidatus Saccharimonadales bacterium]
MRRRYISTRLRVGLALGFSSLVSAGLFFVGAWANNSLEFIYLIWNLFLAWIPVLLVLWLERTLRRKLWSSWEAMTATILWVGFLPNSFYIISDYIHLQEVPRVDLLFDVVMFTAFVLNGLILGYVSLFVVHTELLRRLSTKVSALLVAFTLLVASFAIYIGRDLRWNTWDVLLNPASLLFDVSDRLLNPAAHPQIFTTTVSFFVLLGSIYVALCYVARMVCQQKLTAKE